MYTTEIMYLLSNSSNKHMHYFKKDNPIGYYIIKI